jgi:hypothetical protein
VLAGLELFLAVCTVIAALASLSLRRQRTALEAHLVPAPAETLRETERALAALEEAASLGLRPEGGWEFVRKSVGTQDAKLRTYLAAFLSPDGRAELVISFKRPRVEKRGSDPAVVRAFASRSDHRRCVTYGSTDGPLPPSVTPRDPDVSAREVDVGSLAALREEHERHLAEVGFEPRPLDPAGAPARILEVNQQQVDRLIATGWCERTGDDLRPTWRTVGRMAAAVLSPIGLSARPARDATALALVAAAGGVAAHLAPGVLSSLDPRQIELALAGLFFLLAAAATALVSRTVSGWGAACVPAALVLGDDRCPFAWIAAFVALVVVHLARRLIRR